jgi:hypothetical protein
VSAWWLVPIVLAGAWLVWAVVTFVLLVREAPTVEEALRTPSMIRFHWRDRPHLAFSAPHVARVVREIEAAGFVRLGVLDEAAGLARIPTLVLLSTDGEVKATVWLWMRLAWLQLQPHVNFVSVTNGGTLVYTSDGSALGPAPGFASQVGVGPISERVAMHRALLRQQDGAASQLHATRGEMEELSRTFYARMPPPAHAAGDEPVLPPGVVDGRAAVSLEGETTSVPEPGVGTISGRALLRLAAWALALVIACALGRWDLVFGLFALARVAAIAEGSTSNARRAIRFVEATGFVLLAVAMWRVRNGLESTPWMAAGAVVVLSAWGFLFGSIARERALR